MNNNKLIQIYESALDFETENSYDSSDFQNHNSYFLKKNNDILSSENKPELFHCILNIINFLKIPHKSDDYLILQELNQIKFIPTKHENGLIYSYFKEFNPEKGDYSIIFEYLKNVEYLDNYCFINCQHLKKIALPKKIKNLNLGAFYNCENMEEITLSENIKKLPEICFGHCTNIKTIKIPDSVTEIEKLCFLACNNLKFIKIPEAITCLGEHCFEKCENLNQIEIPETNKNNYIRVGSLLCNNCYNLNKIIIKSDCIIKKCLFFNAPFSAILKNIFNFNNKDNKILTLVVPKQYKNYICAYFLNNPIEKKRTKKCEIQYE